MAIKQDTQAKVVAYLEMCDFPSSKQELLQMADEQEFPDEVMDAIEDLPNQNYSSESAVMEAAMGSVETPVSRGRI